MTLRMFTCAILIATALPACAAGQRAVPGRQFDLVCKTRGHLVKGNHPEWLGYASYNGPSTWKSNFRYAIDLNRRVYRDVADKADSGAHIYKMGDSAVILSKNKETEETYSIASGKYYNLDVLGPYISGVTTGHCRRAKFSGFPAAAPSKANKK